MYFVYVIKSIHYRYIYKGLTNDLSRRLSEHNSGHNKTTRPYAPFVLLYSEQFLDRNSARAKEKWLKSGVGREFISNMPGW